MNFPFPFIDILVIPTGATSGRRIVINGINGDIEVYDSNNKLRIQIGGIGREDQISFIPGDVDDALDGEISAAIIGAGGTRNTALEIFGPTLTGSTNQPSIELRSQSRDLTERSFINFFAQEIAFNDFRLPLGIWFRVPFTANEGAAHTVSGVTDFTMPNLSVRAGHTYAFHLHTQVLLSAAIGLWFLELRLNGTIIDRFERVENLAAATFRKTVDAWVYYTAPTTQATDTFDVFATESSGTADLTCEAGAAFPRYFTVHDIGQL